LEQVSERVHQTAILPSLLVQTLCLPAWQCLALALDDGSSRVGTSAQSSSPVAQLVAIAAAAGDQKQFANPIVATIKAIERRIGMSRSGVCSPALFS
jgi:hypothetical protein